MNKVLTIAIAAAVLPSIKANVNGGPCAECHSEIVRTFAKTAMANSSGLSGAEELRPLASNAAAFSDARQSFQYQVRQDQAGYYFEFRQSIGENQIERRRLPYYVGSGASAITFLLAVDGFLYESPVTWYRRILSWGFSPGYDRYAYPFLTRAVVPRCLECHASGVQSIIGTQNGFETPPFLEGGVSCARCHGAGEKHMARVRAAHAGQGSDIVNPTKLDPVRRDSICGQCHLTGDVTVERARKGSQRFAPGNRLEDYRIAFSRSGTASSNRVTSHVESLAQSLCKRASGERLWCGTCHPAHAVPAPEQKVEWFRQKCLACHAAADCAGKPQARAATLDNCVACHMPKITALDAQHVVTTDHSIPGRLGKKPVRMGGDATTLLAFGLNSVDSRDLALAYAILAVREQKAGDAGRAFDLLKQVVASEPEDAQVLAYLADLYRKHSDDGKAIELYRKLSHADPFDASAPAALGAYAMDRRDYQEAIRLWRAALKISPALPLVRLNLAVALERTGQIAEARAILAKALEFNPNFPAARELLRKLSL